MAKRKVPQVQIGNRFIKAGASNGKTWEVVELWSAVDGILHARLRSCDGRGDSITIAAGVLCDSAVWRAVRVE